MARVRLRKKSCWLLPLYVLSSAAAIGVAGPASAAAQVTVTFNYNGTNGTDGSPQTWKVPAAVDQVTIAASGAQGGGSSGLGGSAQATLPVTPGEDLQVNVGGAGRPFQSNGDPTGGFNGGGGLSGGTAGGGGASDVRRGGTALANRVVVAGGGGGDGGFRFGGVTSPVAGGDGGGTSGTAGEQSPVGGGGGTQSTGGAGGVGNPDSCASAGTGEPGQLGLGGETSGGGGYYGGGGGGFCAFDFSGNGILGGGGGGSGFGPAGVVFATGVRAGHGLVTVTYTNDAPIANAGPNKTVARNLDFTLDARASSDPNGTDALSFHWTQIGGQPAVLRDEDEAVATVEGVTGPQTLTFRVTVTDVHGDSDTDDVAVTVSSK